MNGIVREWEIEAKRRFRDSGKGISGDLRDEGTKGRRDEEE